MTTDTSDGGTAQFSRSESLGRIDGHLKRSRLPASPVLPAYQQVSEQIRELIAEGTLVVGERLPPEVELAVQFGVSRSTVREALRSLWSQGFVYTKRGLNGGTFIAEPSAAEVQIYWETTLGMLLGAETVSVDELREAQDSLALHAVRLAARRSDDQALQQLENSLSSRGEANPSGGLDSLVEFHVSIAKASGNRLFEVVARPLFNLLRLRCGSKGESTAFWATVEKDCRVIVDAVVSGDGDTAARLMRTHLGRLVAVDDEGDPVTQPERGGGGADCWQRPPQRLPDPG